MPKVWVARYAGPADTGDFAASLAVDPIGRRVLVTGTTITPTTSVDYHTIAYARAGERIPTTASLVSSPNPSPIGAPVVYTTTISPRPNGGTVAFSDGGTPIAGCGQVAINTATSEARCHATYTSAGTHTIRAGYSGTSDFAASTPPPLTQKVAPAAAVTLEVDAVKNGPTFTVTTRYSTTTSRCRHDINLRLYLIGLAQFGGTPSGRYPITVDGATSTITLTGTRSRVIREYEVTEKLFCTSNVPGEGQIAVATTPQRFTIDLS